jgi:hypothetical protein
MKSKKHNKFKWLFTLVFTWILSQLSFLLKSIWKNFSGIASLIAVIIAVISLKSNTKSSNLLIDEINRLRDSTIFQFKKNNIASDSLISQIKYLQETTKKQLGTSKTQNTIANNLLIDFENEYRADLYIIQHGTFDPNSHGTFSITTVRVKNKGKHTAKLTNYILAVVSDDRVVVRNRITNFYIDFYSPIINPDSIAIIDLYHITFDPSDLKGEFYLFEYAIFQDMRSGNYYCSEPEFNHFNSDTSERILFPRLSNPPFLERYDKLNKYKAKIIKALKKEYALKKDNAYNEENAFRQAKAFNEEQSLLKNGKYIIPKDLFQ